MSQMPCKIYPAATQTGECNKPIQATEKISRDTINSIEMTEERISDKAAPKYTQAVYAKKKHKQRIRYWREKKNGTF